MLKNKKEISFSYFVSASTKNNINSNVQALERTEGDTLTRNTL